MNRTQRKPRGTARKIVLGAIGAAVVIGATYAIFGLSGARSVALGGAVGTILSLIWAYWPASFRRDPRQRLIKLMESRVKEHFGGHLRLSQFWSGTVADLPRGVGGFIDARHLHGPSDDGRYNVRVDQGQRLYHGPVSGPNAFVYRRRPDLLGVLLIGKAPTPATQPNDWVADTMINAHGVQIKKLPKWAWNYA
jgi:hypothetical protein